MSTDNLAHAIVAFITLVREAEARQQDRKRFRAAAEEVALVLLQQLRVGDRAMVGAVAYEVEQVVWPGSAKEASASETLGIAEQHGARALLRGDRVLVIAERVERGRGPARARVRSVGSQFARRRDVTSGAEVVFDLHMATDEDRLAFAHELGSVIESFGMTAAAEAGELRKSTTDLLSILAD
jgi:hypothetical protein